MRPPFRGVDTAGGILTKGRVRKAFKAISDLDAIVIQNSMHSDAAFFYFTGVREGLFENATVVMRPPDDIELISYILEKESAKGGDYRLTLHEKRDGYPIVMERLSDCRRIGINTAELTVAKLRRLEQGLPRAEFVDISRQLNLQRAVKDRQELSRIRRACRIASQVAEEIPGMVHEGMKETELAAEISRELLRRGSSMLAFFTIVCFGPNTAVAHHAPDDTKLKKGDLIICDFGGSVEKYASDITRTYVLGKATSKQKRIHKAVLRAQSTGMKAMRDGANGRDVHIKVSGVIDRAGFAGRFTHGTGHGLGIDVHDCGAAIHSDIDLPMAKGMVFTVEPGIYLPGYGGVRVEDDVVVKKDGVEALTDAPRGLVEIGRKR